MKTIPAFTISLLVLTSSLIISINPQLIAAAAGPISPTNAEERLDTNNYHSTITRSSDASNTATASLPSTAVGTPTIQAPLQIPRTLQSTDLVNSFAFYEVTFITSTAGAIDRIRIDFPAGTGVGAAGIIERVGIGGGTLLKSGSSITYDVTSPVSIPAGTFLRLEMFGIKNPITPSSTFTADITTRDSGGNLIDGPSQTNVYTIKKIVSSDLADGAVTTPKIAEGAITPSKPAEFFMKKVTLFDDAAGNALGWNPDGVDRLFSITEPGNISFNGALVNFWIHSSSASIFNCEVISQAIPSNTFELGCEFAPLDGSTLQYLVVNLPAHIA
jgi:hypothetical protein